ncbi:hypothetical protein ACFQU1_16355 [Chelatococcus sp. GCM10030263]|uniref:hypothetical protein n=1 Tax=Chelatococcus sp. GCM10030263 TaxID=3273387 RepID=UPI003621E6A3
MLPRVIAIAALAASMGSSVALAASCPEFEVLPGVSATSRSPAAWQADGRKTAAGCKGFVEPHTARGADRPVGDRTPGFMRFGNTEIRIGGQVRAEGSFNR